MYVRSNLATCVSTCNVHGLYMPSACRVRDWCGVRRSEMLVCARVSEKEREAVSDDCAESRCFRRHGIGWEESVTDHNHGNVRTSL